ncbi:TAXI family TRAP transporter solute-binding subunit [Ferrovibrio sp.]|uniref:TAXI family TRAP transporter solute-binding subunit n=1 Tax=Ferrovibrio sp. TaxID=1917215 RepID=UPI00311E2E5E
MTTSVSRRIVMAAISTAVLAGLSAGPAGAKDYYKLSTLGPGSSPYLVMSTFANIVNQAHPDMEVQVNATGAATAHALETARGKMDFFMSSPTVQGFMIEGTAMYAKITDAPELSKNLRSVFNFPLGYYHIVVYADSGITNLEQIKGKRVFLGPPGGGATNTMAQLMKLTTGYEPGKDFEQINLGWEAAAQSFQDKHIDVYMNPTLPPSPVIQQFALTSKIRLLGLTEKQMASDEFKAFSSRPGGVLDQIPAAIYGENQVNKEDVTTIGSIVGIGTRKDMPDEVIYKMTKAFWEGAAKQRDKTPWLRAVRIENVFREMSNMPLHPGAARYYKEVGMTIPAGLMPQ